MVEIVSSNHRSNRCRIPGWDARYHTHVFQGKDWEHGPWFWSGAVREGLSSYSKPRGRGRGHRSFLEVETHLPGSRELSMMSTWKPSLPLRWACQAQRVQVVRVPIPMPLLPLLPPWGGGFCYRGSIKIRWHLIALSSLSLKKPLAEWKTHTLYYIKLRIRRRLGQSGEEE